ncbi:MAG: ubiquinol-cytochrome C chaperone family protein [Hyphomonas sp.]|nr:ubiquinol-cytochrome C chaperone family protein [Hyphomonas sp.]MCB9960773.1 ubiquinol-cytochrome C chaperone family protein [Hyphomonas sp.]MCB9971878.1 ubiquinol-cytochrome C chaperone family protein [Hyphomonas sp.]
MAGLSGILGSKARRRAADSLYRGLMAAALAPEAYAAGIVADDIDHRMQMVAVHAAVLVWQLPKRVDAELRQMPELVHTRVLDGFDAALREMGVGDASIARKARAMAEHYYGLGVAIVDCLDDGPGRNDKLEKVLERNGVAMPGHCAELAAHVAALAERFEEHSSADFLKGSAPWVAYPAASRRSVAKPRGAP